jgi:UDP-3-O-[3-hydroxymyristoyl] glucosamine N-acyltransferase
VAFPLQQLAALSGGELDGDPAQEITGAASLGEAMPGEITFYGNPRYLAAFRKTRASAAFVPADFTDKIVPSQIRVANPTKAFEQIVQKFAPRPIQFVPGVHPTAIVDPSAKLGRDVSIQPWAVIEPQAEIGNGTVIGAGTYIGHATIIGADCLLYPRVTVRERSRVGARVIIHSGAVIGADGFGFEIEQGQQKKVPQLGIVQIDDDVEIGANTTIDRARFGRTWIQQGAKIDNLVQIAHNVVVGRNSVLAAQVGVAGSVRIGERVMIGGQAGIIGHIEIADGTMIGAQTGVSKNLKGGIWWSTPSVPLDEAKTQIAWVRRLGDFFERLKKIEEKLGL